MADYGVAIAKDGWDVFTALNDGMAFISSSFLFKTVATGNYSFTAPAGAAGIVTTSTVAHGLGYKPVVMAYWSADNTNWHPCGYRYGGGAFVYPGGAAWSGNTFGTEVGADTTNFVFSIKDYIGGGSVVYIRYSIYIDSLV